MEKFAMEDLKKLLELTEELKQKYPDVNIDICISEAPAEETSPEQLRAQERELKDEQALVTSAVIKYELELEELEENMPDPYLNEHLDWLVRIGDVEDKVDELNGRLVEIHRELKALRKQRSRRRKAE